MARYFQDDVRLMKFNLKNKTELTFLGIGILMVLIVIGGVTISIRFLIRNLNTALNTKADAEMTATQFQTEKAKALQLQD